MNENTSEGLLPDSLNYDVRASWEKFLNPESLKQNLLLGGLYLAAFELLKQSLVGRLKEFYWTESSDGKDVPSPAYQEKVLDLDRNVYTASAMWWKDRGAINSDDIDSLQEIRMHRNQIAHNMPKMIGVAASNINLDLLKNCHELLFKIDNWWIRNIELDVIEELDCQAFTEEDLERATSGSALFLELMLLVASGDEERLRKIHAAYVARFYPDRIK